MLEKLGLNTDVMIICMLGLIFVLLVLVFVLLGKVTRLSKIYVKYMKGLNGKSLEEKFQEKFDQVDKVLENEETIKNRLTAIEAAKEAGFCKFAVKKYDAFDGIGGKLSFSVCILTESNDGIILSAMHNTGGCYTYLKEIIKGKAFTKLSEQESRVLAEALVYNDPVAEIIKE
ncbi:MAG: DUF4446 family protein [Lachnospiraceae bacterium]